MKLDRQLQILIEEAPQQGISTVVIEKGVTPVLRAFASQLQHLEYYVLQNREGDWIVSAIANIEKPQQQKQVIYAFSTSQDAIHAQANSNLQLKNVSVPVAHLLFQLFALEGVDSLIFLETPNNLEKGIEIPRISLQQSIQQQLQRLKNTPVPKSKTIPSNLA
ncbi:MAG: hypothetical protein MUD14_13080 [Hydrococcus sp. Prado102]|jgi:hypothetical protein|nr:hypothetical protein [Hydrococcus sp. Prado102]